MKCLNCGCDIVDVELGNCANCSAIINATKTNFISYVGSPDSLAGYQKSYKLLLFKYIIEAILDKSDATVARVIPGIKQYYLDRKNKGLPTDYDVDARILDIESSSEYDVFAVIKSQPFKVINEKGYLFLNYNSDDKLTFVFNEDISDTMSSEEWHNIMATNVDSLFYTCKYGVPKMLQKHIGKIINISSVWGNVGASMEVAYSASKGAVNSFTKALAKELAPSNIQVNAIACGLMDTEMNACFSEEDLQYIIEEIPADRMGQPKEVAKLCYMLAEAPEYLTGQIITLDGGWT